MKWYDYVLVFVLVVSSGVLSYFSAIGEMEDKFKVVDIVSLINEEKERIAEADIPLEEKEKRFGDFLSRLERILNSYEGIVLIKQAVVGGNLYEDITAEVRRKLEAEGKGTH